MQTNSKRIEYQVDIEQPTSISRTLKVIVPGHVVKKHLEQGVATLQKTAKIDGFRPGHIPSSVIQQQFGDDIKHRVFHQLIDESFDAIVQEHKLRPVGNPQIDTPDHKTGAGAHDHALHDNQDLKYTATFEVLPELEIKNFKKIPLQKSNIEVTEADIQQLVTTLHESHAQLTPIAAGLILADGSSSSRPSQLGDFVDIAFTGGIVTENGIQARDDLKGSRLLELGQPNFIPGFEENLVGMKRGETKTFKIQFPKEESSEKDAPASVNELSGAEVEFTVTVNEIKEKKLPALDAALIKQMGYDSMEALQKAIREHLTQEKTEDSNRKVKQDLMTHLSSTHPFDVPKGLIENQTRVIAQELVQEYKKQGYDDPTIQNTLAQEWNTLRNTAERQVKSSLILETIADQENISVSSNDITDEMSKMALSMKVEPNKITEFYEKNPNRRNDLIFRLRQERTLEFLLSQAEITWV